jgi:hypothetical protein
MLARLPAEIVSENSSRSFDLAPAFAQLLRRGRQDDKKADVAKAIVSIIPHDPVNPVFLLTFRLDPGLSGTDIRCLFDEWFLLIALPSSERHISGP